MKTRIVIVRHGHVEGIRPRRFRGREDVPLTPLGRSQAKATAAVISGTWKPDCVLVSPMIRCKETGTAIADACGLRIEVLQALNELDYGAWQWKTHEEIGRVFPDLYLRWLATPNLFRFPEGESLQDLTARTSDAIRHVLREYRERTVVMVGHNSVCRALLMQVLDQPLSAYWHLHFDPCGISEVEFLGDAPRALRINETFHLSSIQGNWA
ncbi:histidine phosphatase family protein [Ollibium composti]|uniref:Histidine phosphatase family protein n=1 Tax=Ollibium composti TaxID=2675109 RepID=A0ABY2Q986_9HYPH|nr:histidine phosphatase family protein [Mesorhizobium composti]THF58156.1 histidine phosphatase family protein [Mesorhizobium composti]